MNDSAQDSQAAVLVAGAFSIVSATFLVALLSAFGSGGLIAAGVLLLALAWFVAVERAARAIRLSVALIGGVSLCWGLVAAAL